MKKILLFVLVALVGVYVTGRIMLGESGAMRFVTTMESHMREGDSDAVCAMLHEDLEVNIEDHSGMGGQRNDTTGGKAELCKLTRETIDALAKVPHSMNVNFDGISVTRDWLRPWTSEVSYVERRSLTIRGANITLNTVSEDRITLLQTLSGVRLRKIEANVYLAE